MGAPKSSLLLGKETFLSRTLRVAHEVFGEVLMIDRHSETIGRASADVLFEEPHPGDGPIFGIATALRHSASEKVWLLAVDYPEMTSELLFHLAGEFLRLPCDLLVPEWSGKMQMLCAGYSRALLPVIEKRIAESHFRLRNLIDPGTTCVIREDVLRARFSGEPLMNVNTREEYDLLRRSDASGPG